MHSRTKKVPKVVTHSSTILFHFPPYNFWYLHLIQSLLRTVKNLGIVIHCRFIESPYFLAQSLFLFNLLPTGDSKLAELGLAHLYRDQILGQDHHLQITDHLSPRKHPFKATLWCMCNKQLDPESASKIVLFPVPSWSGNAFFRTVPILSNLTCH